MPSQKTMIFQGLTKYSPDGAPHNVTRVYTFGGVEALGEAYSAGWGIRMRCQRGEHRGIVKIDACRFESDLCLKSLVATRGREFPIARIADRIRCPNCGDLGVMIAFDVPGSPIPVFQPVYYGRRQ